MEEKLAAFRAKKEKERRAEESFLNGIKISFRNMWKRNPEKASSSKEPVAADDGIAPLSLRDNAVTKRNKSLYKENRITEDSDIDEKPLDLECTECVHTNQPTWVKWTLWTLKFLLWLCLWGLFVELEFGAVFFAISVLLFTYFNTRTGPKDSKPSAYSVFNKDFERIQGTLTAEQLQREMFRVPGLPA